jgi:hypothetical protein
MAVQQAGKAAALNGPAEFMNALALSRYSTCLIAFTMEPTKQPNEQGERSNSFYSRRSGTPNAYFDRK